MVRLTKHKVPSDLWCHNHPCSTSLYRYYCSDASKWHQWHSPPLKSRLKDTDSPCNGLVQIHPSVSPSHPHCLLPLHTSNPQWSSHTQSTSPAQSWEPRRDTLGIKATSAHAGGLHSTDFMTMWMQLQGCCLQKIASHIMLNVYC